MGINADLGRLPGFTDLGSWTPREIIWLPGRELYAPGMIIDSAKAYDGKNTDKEDELRPGCLLAQITSTKKWVPCKRSKANGSGDASTALIVDNAAFFKVNDQITIVDNKTIANNTVQQIGRVKDDDSAASNGVAVYLHIDELSESPMAHLEAVNAGNADSTFKIGSSGPVVKVEDDDAAATGGYQIYFDEDATNPDERFLANIAATAKDAFVFASDGSAIRVKHDASASSNGVALYFDDDAANVHERLLFVSPTNANGVYHTDDVVALSTINQTRTTGNAVTAIDYSTNTLTLTSAATWADDDQVYCDNAAGSETARAVLNTYVKLKDRDGTLRDRYIGTDPLRGALLAGCVIDAMLLGDVDAIQSDPANTIFKHLMLDTDYGFVAG